MPTAVGTENFDRDRSDEVAELAGSAPESQGAAVPITVPVALESVEVKKYSHIGGTVVVHITPHEREEVVDVALTDEHVDVKRVEVNRIVDARPPIREENGVIIVPVMEEVLVIEKRLCVTHELHLTRRKQTRHQRHAVTLRSEEARVLRADEPGS